MVFSSEKKKNVYVVLDYFCCRIIMKQCGAVVTKFLVKKDNCFGPMQNKNHLRNQYEDLSLAHRLFSDCACHLNYFFYPVIKVS